jgi:hypothetical protein
VNKQESEIFLGGGKNLVLTTSRLVTCYETLTLTTLNDGALSLEVKIQADFDNVPEKYHEVFLNMMSAKYLKRTSFSDNPFSKCIPASKKRWYQFWK